MTFTVDSVDYSAQVAVKLYEYDMIERNPKTRTTMDGTDHHFNAGLKTQFKRKFLGTTQANAAALAAALNVGYFTLEYDDPYTGDTEEKTMRLTEPAGIELVLSNYAGSHQMWKVKDCAFIER